MKSTIRKFYFLLATLVGVLHSSAQQIEDFESLIKTSSFRSPDAASLGKYGEIPVNLNSGTPQINIPLYEVNSSHLGLNISLSYHGSGIKVNEVASSVGLGWTLNAGGVITRVIRGWPDEVSQRGYYDTFNRYINYIQGSSDTWFGNSFFDDKIIWKLRATQGYLDMEPDVFYFNFNGYSGKIIFNENKEAVFSPFQNLKIEGSILGDWTIITPDGTRYLFDKTERLTHKFGGSYITSWYLSEITTPKSEEQILFDYQYNGYEYNEAYNDFSGYTKKYIFNRKNIDSDVIPYCYNEIFQQEIEEIATLQLKKITFPDQNIKICLVYEDDRKDILAQSSAQRLSAINIYNKDNSILQSFTFNNDDYFVGKVDGAGPECMNKRLKLNSITNNINNTTYTFEYEEQYRMPFYNSPNVDHWGYYNNARNSSIIPDVIPEDLSQIYHFSPMYLRADKETDPNSVKACALKKITYPTGGTSQFIWEANVISYDSVQTIKDFTVNAYYDRNDYTGSNIELNFNNRLKSLYPDDPNMLSARVKITPFIKKSIGMISFQLEGLSETELAEGYYQAYLYPYSDKITEEDIIIIPEQDIDQILSDLSYRISKGPTYYLEAGTYCLVLLATDNFYVPTLSANIYYREPVISRYLDKYVGGIRIKEIKHWDGIRPENIVTHHYHYKKDFIVKNKIDEPLGYQRSSGKLFMDPYNSEYTYYYESKCAKKLVATSFLVDRRGDPFFSEGSHIGYDEVTETISATNGFKITKFWNEKDVTKRNLIVGEQWYDHNRTIKKEILNTYISSGILKNTVGKVNIDLVTSWVSPSIINPVYEIVFSSLAPTYTGGGWSAVSSTIEKIYETEGADPIVNTTDYYYDSALSGKHTFITRKRSLDSSGAEILDFYKYPLDFTTPSTVNFVSKMVDYHMINEPVEQIRKIESKITAAYYRQYMPKLYSRIYDCDFSKYPAVISGIDEFGNLYANTFYRKRYDLSLNNKGNLLSIVKDDAIATSRIYGYGAMQPVVVIENMLYSQIPLSVIANIKQYAFSESLEPDDINGDIDFLKSSLGMLYNNKNYLTTLYTYRPLVGITSMTDSRGVTTYYDYDSSGRLKEVYFYEDGDQNQKKIVEKYDYHYKP